MKDKLIDLLGDDSRYTLHSLHEDDRMCWNCGRIGAHRTSRYSYKLFCDQFCELAWRKKQEYEKKSEELTKAQLLEMLDSKNIEIIRQRSVISELGKEIRKRDHKFGSLLQQKYLENSDLKKQLEKTEEQLKALKNFLETKRDESEKEWIRRYGDVVNWELLKKACLKRDNYMCIVCKSTEDLRVHHLIPLSKGGKNELTNMITLCLKHHKEQHPDNPYIF